MHVNSSQPTGDAYSASHTLSLDSKMVRERGREMVREGDRKGKRGKRRRREKEREGKGREGKPASKNSVYCLVHGDVCVTVAEQWTVQHVQSTGAHELEGPT